MEEEQQEKKKRGVLKLTQAGPKDAEMQRWGQLEERLKSRRMLGKNETLKKKEGPKKLSGKVRPLKEGGGFK